MHKPDPTNVDSFKDRKYRCRYPVLNVSQTMRGYLLVEIPGRTMPLTLEARVFDLLFAEHVPPEAANSHLQPKE